MSTFVGKEKEKRSTSKDVTRGSLNRSPIYGLGVSLFTNTSPWCEPKGMHKINPLSLTPKCPGHPKVAYVWCIKALDLSSYRICQK